MLHCCTLHICFAMFTCILFPYFYTCIITPMHDFRAFKAYVHVFFTYHSTCFLVVALYLYFGPCARLDRVRVEIVCAFDSCARLALVRVEIVCAFGSCVR